MEKYSSTEITESPRIQKFGYQNPRNLSAVNDFKEGVNRNFTTPKITTPVRLNMYASPPKPHVLSPRRYSLSDIATPPRITRRDPISRSSFQHNTSGPLLASTKFNVNLSTYEETKSPGLARRIVQYNQEAEMEKEKIRPPTHQAKYGSPGLFPIVHLFKKSPPTLEQRPKSVKVRISSPGYARQQSEDYKLKLLEGIVKPRTVNKFSHTYQDHSEASTSTRSVLDALREISRKRIHTNEEYDSNEESGKRQRTDFLNVMDTNKRTRDQTSPLLDSPTSPSKPVSKRACVYDEYAASCSSTIYSFKNSDLSGSKRKSISTSNLVENPKNTKQVKLINVETQTNAEEKNTFPKDVEEPIEKLQEDNKEIEESQKKRDSPLKIFDDAPLERIRKNRLAALMGSLTGKDPVLTPKPTFSSILNGDKAGVQVTEEESDKTEKPLVSILTTNKTPQKSDKHVHFSFPEVSASYSNGENSISFTSSTSSGTTAVIKTCDSNAISASLSSPVGLKSTEPNPGFSSNSVNFPLVMPTFSSQNSNQQHQISTSSTSTSFSVPSFTTNSLTTPQFSFGTASNNSLTTVGFPVNSNTQPLTSPPKVGGFKFNLSPSKTTASQNSSTTMAGNPTTTHSVSIKAIEAKSGNLSTDSSTFLFTNVVTTSTSLSFGTLTTASSTGPVSSSSASPFPFGFSTEPKMTSKTDTGKNENTGSVTPSSFSFGNTTTNPLSGITNSTGMSQENKTLPFNLNSTNKTSNGTSMMPSSDFNFVSPQQISTSTVSSIVTKTSFGPVATTNATESANSFGASSAYGSATFGMTAPSAAVIGTSTSTSNTFKTPTTAISSFITALTSSNGFGTTTSSSAFGTPTSANAFGTSTTSSAFGTSITSSAFGTPTTSSAFGTSTTSNVFGTSTTSSAFGTSTTSSGFGTSTTSGGYGTTTTSSGFGTSTTSNGFGTSTTSSGFGSANSFGSKTTSASSFATTTIPSGFSAFATLNKAPNNLDTANHSSGTFGSSSASIFGGSKPATSFANPTTQPSNAFGNPAATFQTPNAPTFGQNNASSAFGTTTNATFGTNTFNTVTTTSSSVFGGSTGFGAPANNSSSIFGGSVTTQPSGFGTSNSIFATTSTISPFENTTTTTNSFMPNTTPIFSFGAKTTNAPGNGFGTNTTTSAFGSTNTPSFGSSNAFGNNNNAFGSSTTFGSTGTPSFGPTTTQANGFATQNNTFNTQSGFGIENKPVFGNTTTPSFGTNTAAPVFGSTAPSVGFGTSNTNPPPAFGANTNNSGFGKPQTNTFGSAMPNNFISTSGSFGTNQPQANPPFGSSNTSAPVFNFGGSNTASKPSVFSFGNAPSSSEAPKPNFNFTGGTGAPAFGASSSFSSSVGPSFGAPNAGATQFGANTGTAPNMFNIGSGSPSTRNRTMIRAKRRN